MLSVNPVMLSVSTVMLSVNPVILSVKTISMIFEAGHLYHIFNQGNNRQAVFYDRENYLFFLKKMRLYILPYADIMAWCLMPNHFHLLVEVHKVTDSITSSDAISQSHRTFNDSIGLLLRSYTRAINNQKKLNGSLFRPHTQSICLTQHNKLSHSWFNTVFGTQINTHISEKEYPQICFNYIHLNPVTAGLVEKVEDWEFSSVRDYAGLRQGTLINKNITEKYEIEFNSRGN
jgi:putative transposase